MHRPFSARNEDSGFTLVEVVVAMLVFAIIATGFLMTLTAGLVTTRDTRTRIVAANLASQQIDLIRSQDVFDVTSSTRDITLNGDTFHVDVESTWATASGATASCDTTGSTDALAYRQVTVEVTWDNMAAGSRPVYSDTSLAPSSKINDPSRGTVLVSVIDSAGVGVSGATVSLSPSNGVAAVTTDSDGCAYLLKVPPATSYTVGVSKSNYVNEQHLASPTATVTVSAGSTSQASFAYDKATTFRLTYANNVSGPVSLPTNLTTTAMSTYGNSQLPPTTGNPETFSLYPIASGYSLVAGGYAPPAEDVTKTCLAPDPGEWLEAPPLVGKRPDAVAGAPGGTVNASVAMGVVRLTGLTGTTNPYLTAVYAGGGAGDPGCGYSPKPTYTFANGTISSGTATIALPYGTWKLYRGSSSGSLGTQLKSGITPATTGAVTGTGAATVVTLDPRVAP